MSICIFPGRFQPFHNGHLMVVQGMMKACGQCVIVVCHGGKGEHDIMNIDKVRESISAALLEIDIVDANIVAVSDNPSDPEWADKVLEAAGRPESPTVWSGDENVRQIFEAKGVATKKIVHVPGIVSDEIRLMIEDGHSGWKAKIPSAVAEVVERSRRK